MNKNENENAIEVLEPVSTTDTAETEEKNEPKSKSTTKVVAAAATVVAAIAVPVLYFFVIRPAVKRAKELNAVETDIEVTTEG